MTDPILTPAVRAWAARTRPGARVTGCTVQPLTGGYVSGRVERVTLQLTGDHASADMENPENVPMELVRKDVPAHEIAGLRAAQPLRPDATAIPELVAWGEAWLMTPLAPGAALAHGQAPPPALFDSLAALHARYQGDAGLPAPIPRVSPAWWRSLCQHWVVPGLRAPAARHPAAVTERARSLVARAATWPGAAAALAELPATLLHGDVHPGNILVEEGRPTLIDWGSARVGPAALDLANLVPADSPGVARYAAAWPALTGQPLPDGVLELGYRWAALQIPVQYLPWTAAHRPTTAFTKALDQIDQALAHLT